MPPFAGTVLYFAYGSNMLLERLRAPNRCPGAIRISNAVVNNFALAFDKPSVDDSGKATIHPHADSIVQGVIFQIPLSQLPALDAAEGLGSGYARIEDFSVATESGALTALTYIADKTRHDLQPYDWYLQLIVAGAKQAGLPEGYVDGLKGLASIPDPKPNRPARLDALQALRAANLA